MKRLVLLVAITMAATAGTASANSEAMITFVGSIVQEACTAAQPPRVMQSGERHCGTRAAGAVYMERTVVAHGATGVAMLDYFVDRPDGASKYVVTRQFI